MEIIGGQYVQLPQPPREGGLSVIYKAFDPSDAGMVAVKLVARTDNHLRELGYQREVASLRKLSHPNIIRLKASGVDEERNSHFLVLEWVEDSLQSILDTKGPYEWEELADKIAVPLARALSYAHLNRVEHRDIKPSNVLVTEAGEPLLADFGIAKVVQGEPSDHTLVASHSGPYTPPERDGATKWVRDVYSMGVLLIRSMHKDRLRTFADIAPALQAINVPPDVRKLLARCVEVDSSLRPLNGAVFADELTNVLRGRAVLPVASRSTMWLTLTQAVRKQLMEHADDPDTTPEAVVKNDLSDDVYAEYRYDGPKRSADRSTVSVAGKQWKFTLKLDRPPALVVTNARLLEYEQLERFRKHALNVGDFASWVYSEPRSRLQAANGRDDLLRALDDHDEQKDLQRQGDLTVGYDGLDILSEWNKVLQAREDLARGSMMTFNYTDRVVRGREVDLVLREPVEEDLIGTDWEIVGESRRPLAYGQVIGQDDTTLTLRGKRAISGLPPAGVVRPYLGPATIALQRQRDALSALGDGTAARPDLRAKIQDPALVDPPVPCEVSEWSKDLDESKKEAVESALGLADVLLVEGPPGTGKTDLIAEIVLQSLKERPTARILIVSQTHVAVDNALARLEQSGVSGIVRLGHPDDPRVDQSVRHLLLDQRMAQWSEKVRRNAMRHLEKLARENGMDVRHLHAALSLRQLSKVAGERADVEREIDRRAQGQSSATELATSLEIVEDDSHLQERVDDLDSRYAQLYAEAVEHLEGDVTLPGELTADLALTVADAVLGTSSAARRLLDLVDLQAQWLQRTKSDQRLAEAFLGTAKVIAGTCIGFVGHSAVRNLEIDLCVLDEASKATATEALVPLSRSKRAILVGDINQLPPQEEDLLRSKEILEEHGIDRQLVEETLFKWFSDRLPEHSKFQLRDQYRMIAPIGNLVSTCFYEGRLHSPRTEGLQGYGLLGKPVRWIDTAGLGSGRRETPGQGGISFVNRGEVKIVFDRLHTLENAIAKRVVRLPEPDGKLEVLLIAPYRRQVTELKRKLSASTFKWLQVDVLSVDAVQGRQCDVAIFSVTRSNSQLKLGFLGADHWRRINVAVSRARYGLTIVGDAEFCRSTDGALQQVVRYMEKHPEDCEVVQGA
ncbi:AAA domain-containing protein [Lentzea flaviverrucosa]|uniref:Protein kinase domain-containing protein n=1 Tax=Lentzea flaviverrucosa TaxID=200379 RepID=A0A1H9SH69_9PSEU|nr:AAA domain-containing protein [Lentzea flaviverrucosa]RDI25368.1 protein kinase-like protein [Lentzea flaviverrucosa]SER84248.1 Protein kinase domain-containing protein [Lentzea flaviverrucosa]